MSDERELSWTQRQLDDLAAENVRLTGRATKWQRELEVRRRGYTLLSKLGRTLGAHSDLKPALAAALSIVEAGLQVQRTVALERAGDAYVPFAWTGYTGSEIDRIARARIRFPAGRLQHGVLVTRETPEEDWIEAVRADLGVPMFVAAGAGDVALAAGRVAEVGAFYLRLDQADAATLAVVGELVATAVQNERLKAEVRAQLEQVSRSRARIVEASDAERRRIERDLHDGAQQRLVSLSLTLRLLETASAQEREQLLAEAQSHASLAVEELRALARGIHPPVLTEAGLAAALKGLAQVARIPIRFGELPADRLPAPVEVAAYFVCSEAVTNAAKHAGATEVVIDVMAAAGRVMIAVADDGRGGASLDGGTGLRGLCDRIEALSGRLEIASPRGGGTRLRAELPLTDHVEGFP